MRLVRFDETPPTRWANGIGETVELWRTPSAGDFDVRLSIATVGSSAPFSPLPGVDRVLVALGVHGLELDVDGVRTVLGQYDGLAFAGESAVAAVGVSESAHDLNLMVRRGVGRPDLRVESVAGSSVPGADALAVVLLDGDVRCDGRPLAFGDTCIGPGTLTGSGRVAVARTS